MSPPLLQAFIPTALPDHCEPSSAFLTAISTYTHTCIPTPLALISSTLGTLSIISWLFAQLPQIYKNYSLQSTSGLSPFFLVEWCLGDSTNLLGALFTDQAGWQVTIAGYYVTVDIVLVFQYYWYTIVKPRYWPNQDSVHWRGGDGDGEVFEGISPFENESANGTPGPDSAKSTEPKDIGSKGRPIDSPSGNSMSFTNEKVGSSSRQIVRSGSSSMMPTASPRTVLFVSMLCAVLANAASIPPPGASGGQVVAQADKTAIRTAGQILSWCSTFFYLASRLPQLYKNYCRKSTSGLSPLLFFAAFCGNSFYSSSLITNPNAWHDFAPYGGGGWAGSEGSRRGEWIARAIPFFLGAAGVLGLDGAMGLQFVIYGEHEEDEIMLESPSGRGRSRWRRVSGWMRGWIPSVSPDRKPTAEEAQTLLRRDHDHGHDNGRYGAA